LNEKFKVHELKVSDSVVGEIRVVNQLRTRTSSQPARRPVVANELGFLRVTPR